MTKQLNPQHQHKPGTHVFSSSFSLVPIKQLRNGGQGLSVSLQRQKAFQKQILKLSKSSAIDTT
jgi:hypothetical protein